MNPWTSASTCAKTGPPRGARRRSPADSALPRSAFKDAVARARGGGKSTVAANLAPRSRSARRGTGTPTSTTVAADDDGIDGALINERTDVRSRGLACA